MISSLVLLGPVYRHLVHHLHEDSFSKQGVSYPRNTPNTGVSIRAVGLWSVTAAGTMDTMSCVGYWGVGSNQPAKTADGCTWGAWIVSTTGLRR